jgi:hypothetical protein
MRENHHDIALLLESKMVFSGTPDELASAGGRRPSVYETEEVYSGLRAQDLQEAKDQVPNKIVQIFVSLMKCIMQVSFKKFDSKCL